jgi:hypothetical protein
MHPGAGLRQRLTTTATRCAWAGTLAIVLLVRLLFVVTYPLNDFGGDSGNYRTMLLQGQSSLVHAGGYPFLIGLPFRIRPIQSWLSGSLPYVILIVQHAIDGVALFVLYRVTSDVFGRLAAAAALVLAGLNLQGISATSAVYPEWLQADLLVLSLGAAYYAYTREDSRGKVLLYGTAAFAFSWCMLVKFNVVVLGFFLLVVLAAEPLSIKRRFTLAVTCVLVGVLTVAPYLRFYQYRSTGTYALTYDAAWVLLTRVQMAFGDTLDPRDGLNTRRWLALSSVLPRSYQFAGPGLFAHVDAVPADVRARYRARYGFLVRADSDQVDRILARNSLPDGFNVGLSTIPIAYYIGLPESDNLGVRVALEAIRAHPAAFSAVVCREIEQVVRRWPGDAPFAVTANLPAFGVTASATLPLGYVRVQQRPDYWNVPFSYSVPLLWWPGLRLFTAMNEHGLPGNWPSFALALAIVVAVWRVVLQKRIDIQSGVTLLLAALVVIMVVVSIITLAFRWKEARLVLPLVSVLGGAAVGGVVSAASAAWRLVGRLVRRREPVSARPGRA